MISTLTTKRAQLKDGYYQSGSGPTQILLIGSCRTLAYLNYLDRWNKQSGNNLTIRRIDPTDWNYNERDEIVDLEAAVRACEADTRVLAVLRSSKIYLHEFYSYYGMFNSSKDAPKNIYQFGLSPEVDVCLPNFHDRFVLFSEQIGFDANLRTRIRAQGLTQELLGGMTDAGLAALEKFYAICRMSSFPEFADYFKNWWTRKRFFWTGNHVSRHFTLYIFRELNDRYLHLPLSESFWRDIDTEDQFAFPCTPVTQYDVDAYGLQWGGTIEPLKMP